MGEAGDARLVGQVQGRDLDAGDVHQLGGGVLRPPGRDDDVGPAAASARVASRPMPE